MEKNYYHVKFDKNTNISHETPSGKDVEVIPLNNAKILKLKYADGNESVTIINDNEIEVYASFPINFINQ